MASQTKRSAWDKTKATSNSFFNKVGAPINKLSQKVGAEAFWPATLDQESDKAARILRSFCIDGFMVRLMGIIVRSRLRQVLTPIPFALGRPSKVASMAMRRRTSRSITFRPR